MCFLMPQVGSRKLETPNLQTRPAIKMLLTSQFLQFSYLESIKIDEKLYTNIFLLFLFVIYLKNTIHILNSLPN
jgi:uncharacterized membrane protein